MIDLGSHEIKAWRQHPATQELIKRLKETREERKEMWASGHFTHEDAIATSVMNAKELAYVQMLDTVIDAVDELVEEAVEGENS